MQPVAKSGRSLIHWLALFVGGALFASILGLATYVQPIRLKALASLDSSLQDRLLEFLPMQPLDDLVLLGVDDPSLMVADEEAEIVKASRPLTLMSEDFPWSREVWAHVVERLIEAGAKAVVIDLLFDKDGRKHPEGDAAFQEVLARYPDRVALACKFDYPSHASAGGAAHVLLPSLTILPEDGSIDENAGFVNFWPDETDSRVRGTFWNTTTSRVNNATPHPDEEVFPSLAALTCRLIGEEDRVPDGFEFYRMRWLRGIEEIYPARSLYTIFWPSLWQHNFKEGELFRDKVVFIGPTAFQFQDRHPTAIGDISGPHIHLNAITAARQGAFFRAASPWTSFWATIAAGLISVCLVGFAAKPVRIFIGLLIGGPILFVVIGGVFVAVDQLVGLAGPLGAFLGAGLAGFAVDSVREFREKQRLRRALEQRMPKEVVAEILGNPDSYYTRLGGSRQAVTILFSDVRGFTALTERSQPEELVEQLNEYFDAMVRVIFLNRGTIDKFIGDAIMAVWGNVQTMRPEESSRLAARAAQQMFRELEVLNQRWREKGKPELGMGIGIHHGEALTGNIGSEEKMELTVIGDAVNLAARLESLTKQYGARIAVSEAVASRLKDRRDVRHLDRVRVVGKAEPTDIHELASLSEDREARRRFCAIVNQGFEALFARDFDGAKEHLEEALEEAPGDLALEKLLDRVRAYQKEPPPEDWDGSEALTKK